MDIWTAIEPKLVLSLGLPLILNEPPASSVKYLYQEGYSDQFKAK